MLLEEKDCTTVHLTIRTDQSNLRGNEPQFLPFNNQVMDAGADPCHPIRIFEQLAPASFAERFPRLTFGAIAAMILLATLTAEIDCLRGSGYFWQ